MEHREGPLQSPEKSVESLAQDVNAGVAIHPFFRNIPERIENWTGDAFETGFKLAEEGIEIVQSLLEKKKEEYPFLPPRTFEYPEGFEGMKPLSVQLELLKELFPRLDYSHAERLIEETALQFNEPTHKGLEGAEGWALLPPWQRIAATYKDALKHVLDLLAERGILNPKWWEEWEGRFKVKEREHTKEMFKEVRTQQENNDLMIVPVQFGLRYRGFPPVEARKIIESKGSREFGLTAFNVAVLLLTHPERFKDSTDLWIHCIGDEIDSDNDGEHEHLPCIGKSRGLVRFMDSYEKIGGNLTGAATGFSWGPEEKKKEVIA